MSVTGKLRIAVLEAKLANVPGEFKLEVLVAGAFEQRCRVYVGSDNPREKFDVDVEEMGMLGVKITPVNFKGSAPHVRIGMCQELNVKKIKSSSGWTTTLPMLDGEGNEPRDGKSVKLLIKMWKSSDGEGVAPDDERSDLAEDEDCQVDVASDEGHNEEEEDAYREEEHEEQEDQEEQEEEEEKKEEGSEDELSGKIGILVDPARLPESVCEEWTTSIKAEGDWSVRECQVVKVSGRPFRDEARFDVELDNLRLVEIEFTPDREDYEESECLNAQFLVSPRDAATEAEKESPMVTGEGDDSGRVMVIKVTTKPAADDDDEEDAADEEVASDDEDVDLQWRKEIRKLERKDEDGFNGGVRVRIWEASLPRAVEDWNVHYVIHAEDGPKVETDLVCRDSNPKFKVKKYTRTIHLNFDVTAVLLNSLRGRHDFLQKPAKKKQEEWVMLEVKVYGNDKGQDSYPSSSEDDDDDEAKSGSDADSDDGDQDADSDEDEEKEEKRKIPDKQRGKKAAEKPAKKEKEVKQKKPRKCTSCNGKKTKKCSQCNGKGTHAGARGKDVKCSVCKGKGAVNCTLCKGKGELA